MPSSTPLDTTADRSAIVEQLNRILASPLFRHSKRCGPLLRHLVLETLDNHSESLKERALGISVFGREPAYDTNDDPIVRSAAGEVRKRIAQYYHEPGHEGELRIELTPGSYVPHFYAPAAPTIAAEPEAPPIRADTRIPARVVAICATALVIVIAAVWAVTARRASPMNLFWAPIADGETVILAAGDVNDNPAPRPQGGPASFAQTSQGDTIGFADALAMARVSALLAARGSRVEIRRAGALTLTDLRRDPAVLIGEMNNPWTKLLEGQMRFRFVWDTAAGTVRIEDQKNPAAPLWQLNWNAPYARLAEDRAIVTRVIDPRTEHAVVELAGCGRDGTVAAAEFVSGPRYMDDLARRAPSGWGRRNLQVVLATEVVNGHSGPPRIVATNFW